MSWATPTSGDEDHAPHTSRLRDDAEEINWHDDSACPSRVRVLRWTCDCRTPVYELASTGGQLIIIRKEWGRTWYSPPMRYRIGEELWEKILAGLAY